MRIVATIIAGLLMAACSGGAKTSSQSTAQSANAIQPHAFSADSAMAYAERQVGFGPRIPRSAAHQSCARWIRDELIRRGADTVVISGNDSIRNILARFSGRLSADNPDAPRAPHVLLLAHYDTRPLADQESDPTRRRPFDGANDGASGVAVLLEIARQLSLGRPDADIDLLFVDLEDSGVEADEASWCHGSRHFAENLPYGDTDTHPEYAIVLDMVGGRDARFHREQFSQVYAPKVCDRIWNLARTIGLADRFPNELGGAITDDHLPLNEAGIPTVDIVETMNPTTGSFPPTWHTLDDNLDNLSTETLGDVGRLVTTLIYLEK